MNQFLRGVARAAVESFALPDPVLEIGSYQVEGQADLIDLRSMFAAGPTPGSISAPARVSISSRTSRTCRCPTRPLEQWSRSAYSST